MDSATGDSRNDEAPDWPKRTGKRPGDARQYPREIREKAKLLWASGECSSDDEIAERLGIRRRQTIVKWRSEDREAWLRARDELAQQKSIAAVRKLGEELGDVVARQLKQVRGIQNRLLKELLRDDLEAATPESVANALLRAMDKEIELCGGARQTTPHLVGQLNEEQLRERVRVRLEEIRELREQDLADTVGS